MMTRFEPLSFQQDSVGASEVDVSRSKIAQALVIAVMVRLIATARVLFLAQGLNSSA
jgi:hypothetical protein